MKIAVLVSGGVDSSVALALLKEQGHDVTAFYLKIWLEDELSFLGECPWGDDLGYVQDVCDQLQVPLQVVNLQREYWDRVVSYTIDQVKAGRTPNPDVLCNSRVKFGAFYDHLHEQFDYVATGHYARIIRDQANGQVQLAMTPDAIKDQTYFLAHLTQAQLQRVLFPLGDLCKTDVRALAQKFNLPNKDRKDSQGICFLGKIKFSEFIKFHVGEHPGEIREAETGVVLGQHKGFWFHTIGQRQGLGLSGGPWYVHSKDTEHNIVYVSRDYYAPDKQRDTFTVVDCNWIAGEPPQVLDGLTVKMRHGPKRYACQLHCEDNHVVVKLAERDQGIAPGQFAVFYHGDICLGSGVIAG